MREFGWKSEKQFKDRYFINISEYYIWEGNNMLTSMYFNFLFSIDFPPVV